MRSANWKRMAVVVALCALVGALAGIAGSAAAPSKKSKSTQAQKKAQKQERFRGFHRGPFGRGGPGGPPLHAETVVPNADGTDFLTIVMDSGTLLSVDGTTVHLKQATDKATYKADAAIDVGDKAKVMRNGKDAKLSDLKKDDHVHVIQGGPDGTVVLARDDSFKPRMHRHHRFGHGRGGPPGPPGMAPPGAMYPGGEGDTDNS